MIGSLELALCDTQGQLFELSGERGVASEAFIKAFIERAQKLLAQEGPHLVVTPNAEIVQQAGKDGEFSSLIAGADLVIPDGVGVIYASKILGRPLKGRVPGVDKFVECNAI